MIVGAVWRPVVRLSAAGEEGFTASGPDPQELFSPKHHFITEYYAHAYPTTKLDPFHVAFALFGFAVILVGITDHARPGNAAARDTSDLSPLAEKFANRAVECIEARKVSL